MRKLTERPGMSGDFVTEATGRSHVNLKKRAHDQDFDLYFSLKQQRKKCIDPSNVPVYKKRNTAY